MQLIELRRGLLHLHSTLVEWERAAYERTHGRVTNRELLHLLLRDPQFAWLRSLSALVVRIDEALEADTGEVPVDAAAFAREARELLRADEAGSPFARRYDAALQELPDAVFAHREIMRLLKAE